MFEVVLKTTTMNSLLSFTIPKPCHENWDTMNPREKGRFCDSCAKTVIDFTKKSKQEIQVYLSEKRKNRVCGHFYKKQLDAITIEIPRDAFCQKLPFQKLFVLALFIAMGTTLFSCSSPNGGKQKIEHVILINTIKEIEKKIDINIFNTDSLIKSRKIPPPPKTVGIMICEPETSKNITIVESSFYEITETTGEIELIKNPKEILEIVEEEEIIDGEIVIGMIIPEFPRFQIAENFTEEKAKDHFQKKIKKLILEKLNINTTINLGLPSGEYIIHTQFIIDSQGNTTDIKVKAPHPFLKKEILKILNSFPVFIPGKQRGFPLKSKYTLPIRFIVE